MAKAGRWLACCLPQQRWVSLIYMYAASGPPSGGKMGYGSDTMQYIGWEGIPSCGGPEMGHVNGCEWIPSSGKPR